MGAGIAALACASGISTVLCEVDDDRVAAAVDRVEKELARRGTMSVEDVVAAKRRLLASAELEAAAGATLALEAVPEDLALKRETLERLGHIAPRAVLATNTSSIPIATLAAATSFPERVLGLHFFNPPGAIRLVELVRAPATAEEGAATARALAEAMGRVVVPVADGPGFLVNRCARPYYLEALRIVEAGVAAPAEVDASCEREGFPMGPFRLMDLIGIDVSLAVTRSLWERSGREPRWAPSPIQERMVAAGRLGRKTGGGFYLDDGEPVELPEASEPGTRTADAGVVPRIVAQLVNEAWFALDAQVAAADQVDLAMTTALRYPRGPFAWGREIGLDRVVDLLDRLAGADGDPRYGVAAGLRSAAGPTADSS